jgi:maltose phosphorylase
LQQDGFLDKELVRVADLTQAKDQSIKNGLGIEFYVRLTSKLMFCSFYFFEDHFSREELKN